MGMNRTEALQAAVGVFLQYGYRKSSMEDLARAIGVSRQWVYQQFESKEKLFREAVEHALESTLAESIAAIEADGALADRLLASFDCWCGQHVESFARAPHATEIMEAATSAFGDKIMQARTAYESVIGAAIESAGVRLPAGVDGNDVGALLISATDGLKKYVHTREAYLEQMQRYIGVVLADRVTE